LTYIKEGWGGLLFWWKEYWWIFSVKSCSEGIIEGLTEGIIARARII
jgi:hypothetical protein